MGYLRISLIIAVVYYHLSEQTLAGPSSVYGFFVLSGYVITLVSAEIYSGGWRGKGYFLANRAARVFPTYLTCLLISYLCMWSTGFTTGEYQKEFTLPTTWQHWLAQFTILGQSDFTGERLPERILPPAWSLSTEVFYYLLIGLVTGRSKWLSLGGLGVSIAIVAHAFYREYGYQFFYFSIQGPAVAFYIGACFYHFRHLFKGFYLRNVWLIALLGNAVIYAPDILDLPRKNVPVLYITSFYLAYFIMCLHVRSQEIKATKSDQFFADITYPMFLLHWPVGALICYHGLAAYQRNIEVFFWALPATFAISALVIFAVETPGKRLRRYFREKARARAVLTVATAPP